MFASRRIALFLFAAMLGLAAPVTWAAPPETKTRPADKTKPPPAATSVIPPQLAKIFAGGVPEGPGDLRAMEKHVRKIAAKVTQATVGIGMRGAGGSGVIVSKDGYVMTVGHVTRQADRDVAIILPNGQAVKGKTLGGNLSVDSGLIKITAKPKGKDGWPYCEMGVSKSLKRGQWCLAAGHPGGFRPNRTPPVRLGRVLRNLSAVIVTDCTIVSGDSGGPLFDMEGRVIGISSRIAGPLDANIHVPVDLYRRDWDRMVKGETWGVMPGRRGGAHLGVMSDATSGKAVIRTVVPGSAADKAGMKPGDVVTKFANHLVSNFPMLAVLIAHKKPGDKVKITVERDGKTLVLQAVLDKRGE